jgi:hypothetical protein
MWRVIGQNTPYMAVGMTQLGPNCVTPNILKEMEAKSTLQISRELGWDYESVLRFVREVHEGASGYARGISLEGVVEVDEVYGHAGKKGERRAGRGRRRGLRKRGRGTWAGDQPPVLTLVKRGRSRKFGSV